jgi:single-strand DNA-binding protein
MADLNKVLLIGNVGAKPELRKTKEGEGVVRIRVATSHNVQGDGQLEKDTEWHTVVAFGRQAEVCAEFLDKGRQVYVEGSLRSHAWKDKEGNEHIDREVRAHQVHFLGSPKSASSNAQPQALAQA